MKFTYVLSAEILKTKRTWNLALVLLLPSIISIIVFGYYLKQIMGQELTGGNNAWISYSRIFFQFYSFLYPLLVAIVAFSLSNIEHKNNGFKQLFTFPVHKSYIYFSKVIILTFWILSSLLLAYSLMMLSGNILSVLFPQIGFQNYDVNSVIITFFIRIFITLISLVSIHFFMSIYWDNFIISVGSATFLVIFGMLIYKWKYSFLIPYCNIQNAFMHFFRNGTQVFSEDILWSIAYSIVFFMGGYLIMIKKSIK